jgi:hypothetical protein
MHCRSSYHREAMLPMCDKHKPFQSDPHSLKNGGGPHVSFTLLRPAVPPHVPEIIYLGRCENITEVQVPSVSMVCVDGY